ncbi:MAG: phosphoribosylamine--glycine ligase [Spirochaetota bacterium]|nr:phosphoribosylamine--glycine ligase [Spirochaetota bacterium]
MKVLVIGSGGREHALVDAISRSDQVSEIFIAPGNGGTTESATAVSIKVDDIASLKKFAEENAIDWTVVGPELPLTLGLVDEFHAAGLKTFGVNRDSAKLEGSKAFSKAILTKYKIPTASYKELHDYQDAKAHVEERSYPLVVKADGLAAGKGVYICQNPEEAHEALTEIFISRRFGDAGNSVVIEDFLDGREISAFAFSDGESVIPLIYAQDYKKIYENDKGPNTGGMGSYTPVSFMTEDFQNEIYENILTTTIQALRCEGITYRGILYAGLMIDKGVPKVLEYNVRFGDPEAQVILPLLKTDILDVFRAIHEGTLKNLRLEWHNKSAVCVVLASDGYPDSFDTGYPISGLDKAGAMDGLTVYHAGTKKSGDDILSTGGRVLNVVALKDTLREAVDTVYQGVSLIDFQNKYYRKDIAQKEL